ncbi:MAG TPA: hypothetical protein VMB70_03030, partial [Terriglobia bacterium]|nr:hypothetical protein [Terriglobia bacterium]
MSSIRKLALAVALGVVCGASARAQSRRAEMPAATSGTFVFYSDPVTNLHDFLVWNARAQEPV